MRKLAILFFLTVLSIGAYAQIPIEGVSSYIKGYWGEWKTPLPSLLANGKYDDLVLYTKGDHPSDFCVHLKIEGFRNQIDKKEKKRRIKKEESYQYNGTIEFYLSETTPTALSWVKSFAIMTPNSKFKDSHIVSFPAIIKIKPYKENPEFYMVYFDNMGIAFTF